MQSLLCQWNIQRQRRVTQLLSVAHGFNENKRTNSIIIKQY
ncbi:hypothetical protein [Caudoviricetes sp.]|nr:hypothetical protein [Caudoviricetes sp.]